MKIGRVLGNLVTHHSLDAFEGRKLMMVEPLDLEGNSAGTATMAIDYVGAGEGDIVIYGAAPGLASTVFNIPNAPINELIMGIIDTFHVHS